MTVIQAFNRTKPYTHTFPDVTLAFKPNESGHVVCDVDSESAVDRLLRVPSAFRVYRTAQVAAAEPVVVVPTIPMPCFALTKVLEAAIGAPEKTVVHATPAADLVTTPEGEKGPEITHPTGEKAEETAEKVQDKPEDETPAAPSGEFVLIAPNGSAFDLKPLDDAALREFAAANSIKVHHAAKGDTIRKAIVDALAAPTAPAA